MLVKRHSNAVLNYPHDIDTMSGGSMVVGTVVLVHTCSWVFMVPLLDVNVSKDIVSGEW